MARLIRAMGCTPAFLAPLRGNLLFWRFFIWSQLAFLTPQCANLLFLSALGALLHRRLRLPARIVDCPPILNCLPDCRKGHLVRVLTGSTCAEVRFNIHLRGELCCFEAYAPLDCIGRFVAMASAGSDLSSEEQLWSCIAQASSTPCHFVCTVWQNMHNLMIACSQHVRCLGRHREWRIDWSELLWYVCAGLCLFVTRGLS